MLYAVLFMPLIQKGEAVVTPTGMAVSDITQGMTVQTGFMVFSVLELLGISLGIAAQAFFGSASNWRR